MAFTGEHSELDTCPHPRCGQPRFHPAPSLKRPRKTYIYIPLIDRLKLQYHSTQRAQQLKSYRGKRQTIPGQLRDIFDGRLYQDYHCGELGLFQNDSDIALHMSLDGVQLTRLRNFEITPIILINLNIPPEERYEEHNILTSMIIPGPKKYKDLDSFMFPLIEELKKLGEGVQSFDGDIQADFQLKAYIIVVTGESRSYTKLNLNLTG